MERAAVTSEEKLFMQQVGQHVEKLHSAASLHRQSRTDGEEREKLATAGFFEREQRYVGEIAAHEDYLQTLINEKENLGCDIVMQTKELKKLNNENAQAIRDHVKTQEITTSEEQQLRKELRDALQLKREFQDSVALNTRDLELLQQENERLRAHVEAFKHKVGDILT